MSTQIAPSPWLSGLIVSAGVVTLVAAAATIVWHAERVGFAGLATALILVMAAKLLHERWSA